MIDWVEADGVSLRYELSGQGKDTLVLLHELGGTLESWDLVMPELQKHFTVLRYDQRGCGLSEKVRGKLTMDMVSRDLAGLLNALLIAGPCLLLGSALGAGISLAFALSYPHLVARIVACTPVVGLKGADFRSFVEKRAQRVEIEGMRNFVEQSLNASYPQIFRGDVKRFQTYKQRWLANDPASFAAINRLVLDMDFADDLNHITCPTLLCAGLLDDVIKKEGIEALSQKIPGSQYMPIEAGHFMAVQSPEILLAHVLPFLLAK